MNLHWPNTKVVSIALLSLICLAGSVMPAGAAGHAFTRVPTEAIGRPDRLNDDARPSATAPLTITVALSANQTEISEFVNSLFDPTSPNYHHWITPAQFGQKFGANSATVSAIIKSLLTSGLSNVRVWPDHLFVSAQGSRSTIESAFGVTIHGYNRSPAEIARGLSSTYYAPDREPSIDSTISGSVAGIFGLSSAAERVPANRKAMAESPFVDSTTGALDPPDLAKAYNITALHNAGLEGQGETIAIFSPTAYRASDINTFLTKNGITNASINIVNVDGGTRDLSGQDEACIDIETIVGQAPKATIDVYEGPNTGSNFDIFEAIEQADPDVLSESWGTYEDEVSASYASSYETIREAMAAEGVSIFVAAGDNGAYDPTTNAVSVSVDASSAYVTAVGGTELTLNNGNWESEVAWTYNDGTTGSDTGSAGGLSVFYPRPSWQNGPGVSNSSSDGYRQIPDVAALASTPYYDIYTEGSYEPFGGTSCAAPLWASSMSLIEQSIGSRLGNIDPTLYSLGTNDGTVYHDITSGNNGLYYCTPGWDFVTGWGSANFGNLLAAFGGSVPTITSFTPSSGLPGVSVTINGTNLANATSVTFGGVASTGITSDSASQIIATVPANAVTGTISVTTALGTATSSGTFTVTSEPTTPTPVITPGSGSYTTAQTVTISDSSLGAAIYYTTNGTTPTTSSTLYTSPISVTTSETINALAVASGDLASTVATATLTIGEPAPAPTITPSGGTFTSQQTVSISDTLAGAAIYYTTNGTTPTINSTPYSGPFTVSSTETVEAIAIASSYTASLPAIASFIIDYPAPTPTMSPNGGTFNGSTSVTITDSVAGASIYYTTNGTTPTTSSTPYTAPITVSTSETITAVAIASGYSLSPPSSAVFTITQSVPLPVISPSGGTFTSSQTVTISDALSGATIYYTTNGTMPTTSSTVYTGPITVSTSETIEAIAVANGYSNSGVSSAAFSIVQIVQTVPTPQITPNGGTFNSAQTVSISDTLAGATIYYTTNGSTPTTSSAVYTSPITVSTSETITALAVETGYTNSEIASAVFTINTATPAPVITPNGGAYNSAQAVTITDSQSGADIFYTTDGSTPTTSSNYYSGPITVTSSETITAIAVVTGFPASSPVSATFTINSQTVAQFSAGLQMISLPYTYSSGVTLDEIFGYSGVTLAVWNPTSEFYAVTPTAPANTIVAGEGYWVRFPQAVTVTLAGTPTPTNAPFVINLREGWNMVGDPFQSVVPLSTVSFSNGSESYSQASGLTNPLIGSEVYTYTAGATEYTTATSLQPNQGYWIFAYSATTMTIPAP